MCTMVRSISAGSVYNSIVTSAPVSTPSLKRGIRTMPSARTSDVITPAPRLNGAATMRSPTLPAVTRTHSSSPIGDSSLRVMLARSVGF